MISFVRTIIMYILVILSMRCMGKRQIGQLQPYEIVVALMIADLASLPMEDNSVPIVNGVIPILSLVLAQIALSFLIMKSNRFRTFISGKSCVVVRHGRIDEQSLKDEMYTVDDLTEALRLKGYTNVADINQARIETNGDLSIIPFGYAAPLERQDMGVEGDEPLRVDVIIAGTLLEENMNSISVDANKLDRAIKKAGGNSVRDVLYASACVDGSFYIQVKERVIKHG